MIRVTFEDENGNEISLELPSKKEVCGECKGEGYVLCDGMRGHAYTAEEFADSFDEEEAQEYFRPGGRYDKKCTCCKGTNVVDVVDVDQLTAAQKADFEIWCEQEERRARFAAEDEAAYRAERRAGA